MSGTSAGGGQGQDHRLIKSQRSFFKAGATVQELQQRLRGGDDDAKPSRSGESPGAQARSTETVRRALPRWFEPRDPVLLLSQARRAYKHGEDRAIDGVLGCRISGQTIDRFGVMPWSDFPGGAQNAPLVDVLGSDLSTADLQSGQIPADCGALFYEALLLDPTSVTVARDAVIKRAGRSETAKRNGVRVVTEAEAGQRVQVEQ